MSLFVWGLIVLWAGVLLFGLIMWRRARQGAWSMTTAEAPEPTGSDRLLILLAAVATLAGTVLVVVDLL